MLLLDEKSSHSCLHKHQVTETYQTENTIIIITITFMQGIYTYIPQTKYIPREYSVAAILLLLFMVLYVVSFSVESIVLLR